MSKNPSKQEIFNTVKVEYEDVIKKSGYNIDLKTPTANHKNKKSKSKT